ncbi:putative methyltransferase [Methanosarcina siciliae C2J]|uniref:Putative methyltransferase n=2 Tax=Methanosarcina siciliae TaxID=38027 RepID=A0A0E3LAI3_9EURY|nr:nicotianamine synthase family protein [Methanosarcina siciliae]AKB32071.1 putative methyltransferase [Methanosarcina siciliae HI350]AKB37324.1 putative methyltransferase [Methanosarcina siciliae C2J]
MVGEVSKKLELSPEYIVEEILGLYRDIRKLSEEEILYGTSDLNRELFRKLDFLVNLEIEDVIAWNILQKKELEPVFAEINRFRNLYTVKLETEHANEILVSDSPWAVLKNFPFYGNYLKLVRTEYEGLGLSPGDRVFFLGSGPLPLTLIVFFQQHGVKSTGVEQDTVRANLSKKVLGKLRLSEVIKIINGNHFSLNGEGFALNPDAEIKALMIAAQAEPKKEIFEHLLEVMPAGSRISCRIYEKGLRRMLNGDCLFDLPEGFDEQARVDPEPPVYNTVVFLEKKR